MHRCVKSAWFIRLTPHLLLKKTTSALFSIHLHHSVFLDSRVTSDQTCTYRSCYNGLLTCISHSRFPSIHPFFFCLPNLICFYLNVSDLVPTPRAAVGRREDWDCYCHTVEKPNRKTAATAVWIAHLLVDWIGQLLFIIQHMKKLDCLSYLHFSLFMPPIAVFIQTGCEMRCMKWGFYLCAHMHVSL